jgi:hypothetical protein
MGLRHASHGPQCPSHSGLFGRAGYFLHPRPGRLSRRPSVVVMASIYDWECPDSTVNLWHFEEQAVPAGGLGVAAPRRRVGRALRRGAKDRHRRRNPSRCHRSTVAGCTSVTAARHEAVHLVSSAIVKRCEPVNITRLRCSPTLRIRQLLSEKLVLCDKRCARTELPSLPTPRGRRASRQSIKRRRPLEQDRRGSRK